MFDFTLKQLEVFVAVVEEKNFTKAADRLFLTQSTVSSHVRTLENTLNFPLFKNNTRRGGKLTPEGMQLYHHAREILLKCEALVNDFNEGAQELVIGASSAPGQTFVPALVAEFSKKHPEFSLTVEYGDSDSIQQKLQDGDIRLGFVGSADNRRELVYDCVAHDRLVVIAPNNKEYRKLKEAGAKGRDLLDRPLVMRESGSGTQKFVNNYLTSLGINDLDIAVYATDLSVLRELVINNAGISVASMLSVEDMVKDGKLLTFELDNEMLNRDIYIARRKKVPIDDPTRAFIDLLIDCDVLPAKNEMLNNAGKKSKSKDKKKGSKKK